jgi:hypothetical protein
MNPEHAKYVAKAIKDLAKINGRFSLNELRIIIALERATARLSASKGLTEHLIFKGGFVLLKIYESTRFTRDTDALAVSISKEKLSDLVGKALAIDLDDGLWFGDLKIEELTEQGEYGAYRFDCAFHIGKPDLRKIKNLSRIHIDIGFSDRLAEKPTPQDMTPVLGDQKPVTWRVYPPEFIVAEKIQTLFDRGSANSRAKDIYDLNYLIPWCTKPGDLFAAIAQTFKNRGTNLPVSLGKDAMQIDTAILARSWPSVEAEDKTDFENAWKKLMGHFRIIDQYAGSR